MLQSIPYPCLLSFLNSTNLILLTLSPFIEVFMTHLFHMIQVSIDKSCYILHPIESYLSHHHPQSYVSILSHPSHVGQVGQSYGILPVPATPILGVCPIPPVKGRTSESVLWNPTCPTITLNPMCPSHQTCPE